jgi:hypothetical protein
LIASHDLKIPMAMRLSLDLIKLHITPQYVWQVLRKIGHIIELRCVCNKVIAPNYSFLLVDILKHFNIGFERANNGVPAVLGQGYKSSCGQLFPFFG